MQDLSLPGLRKGKLAVETGTESQTESCPSFILDDKIKSQYREFGASGALKKHKIFKAFAYIVGDGFRANSVKNKMCN